MFLRQCTGGARPGKPFKPPADENVRKRKYDATRSRQFLSSWLEGRPWLMYDELKNKMFCSWCTEHKMDSQFVTPGSDNFKLDTIKIHEKNKSHKFIALKYEKSAAQPSEAEKCYNILVKADYDRLAIKFRNTHAIAKHQKSFRDYNFLCKLDRAKGLDIGSNYLNDKAAAVFVKSIANVTREDVCGILNKADFFSFTCDGSTDFMGEELENIYVRTCHDGHILDTFLYIGSPESSCSQDIYNLIHGCFESLGLADVFKDRLVGFCSDGAANMQGHKSGLSALLKKTRPELISVHCLAHRLELSFKDAVKTSSQKVYDKALTLLMGLYYFYRKSPTQKKALRRSFKSLDMTIILPTRVGGTRWLPHMNRAIYAFLKGYKAILNQLETCSHTNAKAEGFAKLATDGHVICFILVLKELIGHLMKLSLYLQHRELSLAEASLRVMATKNLLSQIADMELDSVKEVLQEGSFQDRKLRFVGFKPSAKADKMISKLIQSLENRFPSSPVIDAVETTVFKSWPSLRAESSEFGNVNINILKNHFKRILESANVELDELMNEWMLLKSLVYQKFESDLNAVTVTWENVVKTFHGQGLDNIFKLINLVRSLPPTSVNNETTFSHMKLTKGKRRGRMNNSTLNDILLIELQSPDIETFDPDRAIKNWMKTTSGRKRRVAVHAVVEPKKILNEVVVIEHDVNLDENIPMVEGDTEASATPNQDHEPEAAVTPSHDDELETVTDIANVDNVVVPLQLTPLSANLEEKIAQYAKGNLSDEDDYSDDDDDDDDDDYPEMTEKDIDTFFLNFLRE